MHEARYRERGFNQVELIFGAWLEGQGLPLEQALVRTKQTGPLYRMRPSERRQSLKDAFSMARDADVSGKHILLLDDILTTGATLSACAAVLRAPGQRASTCSSLRVTIAEPHGVPFRENLSASVVMLYTYAV